MTDVPGRPRFGPGLCLGIAAILAHDTRAECRCPDCNQRMDLSVKRGGGKATGVVHFLVPPRRFWENIAFT